MSNFMKIICINFFIILKPETTIKISNLYGCYAISFSYYWFHVDY